MQTLIDTSALFAFLMPKDANHDAASRLIRRLPLHQTLIVAPVLSELFYLTRSRLNYPIALQILKRIRSGFPVEHLIDADMIRLEEIMQKYADSRLDYVDAAIIAVSERLKVNRIFTFDRRDFQIFRNPQGYPLELLP